MRLSLAYAVFMATVLTVNCEEDFDDFEDLQTEFYLPYSETEDVDFNIQRPGGSGCYQW